MMGNIEIEYNRLIHLYGLTFLFSSQRYHGHATQTCENEKVKSEFLSMTNKAGLLNNVNN